VEPAEHCLPSRTAVGPATLMDATLRTLVPVLRSAPDRPLQSVKAAIFAAPPLGQAGGEEERERTKVAGERGSAGIILHSFCVMFQN